MYAYGQFNEIKLSTTGTALETNGYVLVSYPKVSIDLETCSVLGTSHVAGKDSDVELGRQRKL